jgi:GTP-sensing pleiotropic transcriptional regulator CodY
LKRLGREHNSLDAIRAIEIAKEVFVTHIHLILPIYARESFLGTLVLAK